jgi:hypothetical protein
MRGPIAVVLREMYLTAQHVRNRQGQEDYQAYLHRHDIPGSESFPNDWRSVPQQHPGLMVAKSPQHLRAGGNAVLSYSDIIARDAWWRQAVPRTLSTVWWRRNFAPIGELVAAGNKPVPWAIDVAGLNVVFNASTQLSLVPEYEMLVDVALQLWEDCLVAYGARDEKRHRRHRPVRWLAVP